MEVKGWQTNLSNEQRIIVSQSFGQAGQAGCGDFLQGGLWTEIYMNNSPLADIISK
jgi:hypothetical protein